MKLALHSSFLILFLALTGSLWGVGTGMAKTTETGLTGEPSDANESASNKNLNSTSTSFASTNQMVDPAGLLSVSSATPSSQVATLSTSDLKEFADQSDSIQRLISQSLELTRLGLVYKYGSADPQTGGMDCSGTVYYLLQNAGIKDVPRDSSELYRWVWKHNAFHAVVSEKSDTFELELLKPGDLLFWTGTYRIDRDPPVTHVMIYLGTQRGSGKRVMVGASEGRTFDGKSRYGVSVFDFKIPVHSSAGSVGGVEAESRFIGYGSVPGLTLTLPRNNPPSVGKEPPKL